MTKTQVLDKGFVRLVDHMGSDLTVVNAARVSFAKESTEFTEKDAGLIRYLAKHEHWCYDDQTEVLTDKGWVYFRKLKDDDRVAQVDVNDNTMSFVVPDKVHRCEYHGSMYLAESGTVNYCVTPGHKMWYQKRTNSGYADFAETTSDEAFGLHHKRFRTTASIYQDGEGTFSEGWLVGFILGDGFCKGPKIGVRLKVSRKIAVLKEKLWESNVFYTLRVHEDGVHEFTIDMDSGFVARCTEKRIPSITGKSTAWIRGVFYGLMESDGSVKHQGWAFSSSSPQLFEDVGFLATLCGYAMSTNKPRHITNLKHNTNYRGIILSRDYGNVKREHESQHMYTGTVYCVTVPTGYIMVRRNGKQMVCGNTPFGHPQITLHFKWPIFVARQAMRSNIGICWNEVSRRYVDDTPEFYCPPVWRKRPEGSIKQGSGESVVDSVANGIYDDAVLAAEDVYRMLIDKGYAPELARAVLPQSTYTECWGTFSLAALARFYKLRADSHAQYEIQMYANAISELVSPLFPVSWNALAGEVE